MCLMVAGFRPYACGGERRCNVCFCDRFFQDRSGPCSQQALLVIVIVKKRSEAAQTFLNSVMHYRLSPEVGAALAFTEWLGNDNNLASGFRKTGYKMQVHILIGIDIRFSVLGGPWVVLTLILTYF